MAETIVNLGMLPNNRGDFDDLPSGALIYKDNIVQYKGSSYIYQPANFDIEHPEGSATTSAPYDDNPSTLNAGWRVFASGNNTFTTGEKVENVGIDNKPTANSNNLVKSGGVQNELALGAVYDVSAKNPTAGPNNDGKWESLSALLSDANLNTIIPTAYRKGGMSIKFIQSSDNKYVQYMYLGIAVTGTPNPFLNTNLWRNISEELYEAVTIEGGSLLLSLTNQTVDSANGQIIDNANRAMTQRIKVYEETTLNVIITVGAVSARGCLFDENDIYVKDISTTSNYKVEQNGYLRFIFNRTGYSGQDLIDNVLDNVNITIDRSSAVWNASEKKLNSEILRSQNFDIQEKYNRLLGNTNIGGSLYLDIQNKSIDSNTGVIGLDNPKRALTELIPAYKGTEFNVTLNTGYSISCLRWKENGEDYAGVTPSSGMVTETLDYTMPENGYVRFYMIKGGGSSDISPEDARANVDISITRKTAVWKVNKDDFDSITNSIVNDINNLILSKSSLELGALDTTTGQPSERTDGTRARSKDFVLVDSKVVIKNELTGITGCNILFYYNNFYKGYVSISKQGGWSVGDVYEYEIPAQQYEYNQAKVVFIGSGFTSTMCDNSELVGYINLAEKFEKSEAEISEVKKYPFIQGRWNSSSDGQLVPSELHSVCNKYFLTGFYIKLEYGYKIQSCCKYDTLGNFIEGYNYTDPIISELNIPEDGYLYRFTLRKTDNSNFSPSDAYSAILTFNYPLYNSIQAELKLRDAAIGNVNTECEQLKEKLEEALSFKPFYLNVPRADGVDGSVDVANLTVASMYSMWDALIQEYPTFLTSVNLGTDESGDYQLRKITFNYSKDASTAPAKRKVVMIVNIHGPGTAGDTKQQAYIVYYFIKWILENKEQNELAGWFIMNYQFVFIPIANPWGFENGSRGNYRNVDLARNFDADWEAGESYAGLSKGTSAASEKETQYAQAMIDANTDAYMFIDFHSHMENNTLMQYLPDSDGYIYNLAKYAKRYCKITANNNLDNGASSESGMPKRYAERVKNIPSLVIEGAVYDGVGNYTSKAMTDTMRMFLSLFRVD